MLKFTIHMSQGPKSWSEAHYGNFLGSPNVQGSEAGALANARQLALGYLAQVNRVVVSNVPANRRSRTYTFQGATQPSSPANPGNSANLSEMSNNAPLVQWVGRTIASPPLDAPPANYYPAGCYTSLFNVAGPDAGELNKGSTGYGVLVSWLLFLVGQSTVPGAQSNWCYRTRNPVGAIPASGLAVQAIAPNLLGVTTLSQLVDPTNTNAPIVAGQKVYLSGWRVNNPRRKNLQGAYKVQSVLTAAGPPATWTYYLYGTANADPTLWPVPGQIGPLLFTFASYQGYTVEQWVTRKRGGRYDLALGRSPIHRT